MRSFGLTETNMGSEITPANEGGVERMKELTNQQLLNVLKAAKELELDSAFIALLEKELMLRGINIKPGKESEHE